jgi:hypothetical protein
MIAKKSIAELRDDLDAHAAAPPEDIAAAKRARELEAQLCIKLCGTGREKDLDEASGRCEAMWNDYLNPSVKRHKDLRDLSAVWTMRLTICSLMARTNARFNRKADEEKWNSRATASSTVSKSMLDDFFESERPQEARRKIIGLQQSVEQRLQPNANAAGQAAANDDEDEDEDYEKFQQRRYANMRRLARRDFLSQEEANEEDEQYTSKEELVDSLFKLEKGTPMEKYRHECNKHHTLFEAFLGNKEPGPRHT